MNDRLFEFLIQCCQDNQSQDDIYSIVTSIDTQNIIDHAQKQGILPIVYKRLKSIDNIPNDLISKLKIRYMQIAKKNILMSAELIKIIKLLETNNIKAIAFKGPSLANLAYQDITMRQFGDIDILIDKKDIYKINAVLLSNGYKKYLNLSNKQEKVWIKNAHDMGYIQTLNHTHLELHWAFLDDDYPLHLELKNFWEDTQTITINNKKVQTFSNENLLYYLSIHGSKHLWERIEWIKDIDLLIRTQDINWDKLISQINPEFDKMFYLGIILTNKLYDTPLPNHIQERISSYYTLHKIVDFILDSWHTQKNMTQQTKIILKLFPTIKTKLQYLYKILIKPSINEYNYIELPSYLYFGYYFIRPYLLIKKYLS